MKKKVTEFEEMGLVERRDFLKMATAMLSAPFMPNALNYAVHELLIGEAKAADLMSNLPTFFLEVNVRDQWDFGHLFVPPWVGQNYNNIRSQVAVFDTPVPERANFWVTADTQELRPHLDDIAVMELGECPLPGNQSVHGHEAGNPLRSPGRVKAGDAGSAGKLPMDNADRRPQDSGNEPLVSSSPTPLILHNHANRTATPGARNGILIRSTIRQGTQTFYHFAGNLLNAQVDRYFDPATLMRNFSNITPTQPTQNPTTLQKHTSLISSLIKKVDERFARQVALAAREKQQHDGYLTNFGASAQQPAAPPAQPFSLPLTTAEREYWTRDVPGQMICGGDDSNSCSAVRKEFNIGELFGYAFKLFQGDIVRSVGLDFDFHDVHGPRNSFVVRTQAVQSGRPLARFITACKEAGIWDRTVVAMYTLDGSRSITPDSYGDNSKNSIVLAGGRVKGGYYGDIRLSGGTPMYHRPDDTGAPVATGQRDRAGRVPAADIYKTVATAMRVPTATIDGLADVRGGKILQYMLKA